MPMACAFGLEYVSADLVIALSPDRRGNLALPENEVAVRGTSIGYTDLPQPENAMVSKREEVDTRAFSEVVQCHAALRVASGGRGKAPGSPAAWLESH